MSSNRETLSDNEKCVFSLIAFLAFVAIVGVIGSAQFRSSESPSTPPSAAAPTKDLRTVMGLNKTDVDLITTILTTLGGLTIAILGHAYTRIESQRAQQTKINEQATLKVKTLVEAVELLGASKDELDVSSKQYGALLALAELEHVEFALTLLWPILDSEKVNPRSAVWLIDIGMRSESRSAQDLACYLLYSIEYKLTLKDGDFAWPPSVRRKWMVTLSLESRQYVLVALIGCIIGADGESNNLQDPHPMALLDIVVTLGEVIKSETDSQMTTAAAAYAKCLIERMSDATAKASIAEISRAVHSRFGNTNPDAFITVPVLHRRYVRLTTWIKKLKKEVNV